MITSALISEVRREVGDSPRATRVARAGDGTTKLFNVGRYPIKENTAVVYKGTSGQTITTDFTLDLDNGDLLFVAAPGANIQAISEFKYANWRDKHYMEAIGNAIEDLHARGYFRQSVRLAFGISANVRTFGAPSATVDVYQIEYAPAANTFSKMPFNWAYQSDANKIAFGTMPTSRLSGYISYLRRMNRPSAVGMALDVKDDWLPLLKKNVKAQYWSHLAGKVAQTGNAKVEDGHFSYTSHRVQASDLYQQFDREAMRAKPTRPAKDIQFSDGSGV